MKNTFSKKFLMVALMLVMVVTFSTPIIAMAEDTTPYKSISVVVEKGQTRVAGQPFEPVYKLYGYEGLEKLGKKTEITDKSDVIIEYAGSVVHFKYHGMETTGWIQVVDKAEPPKPAEPEKKITVNMTKGSRYELSLDGWSFTYTGSPIKPGLKAYNADSPFNRISADNYTIKYYNNTKPGTAKAVITWKGDCAGNPTVTKEFNIWPKKPTFLAYKAAKKSISVKLKGEKKHAASYEVRIYPTNKTTACAVVKKCTPSKPIVTFKKLSRKTTYYVEARAIKNGVKSGWTSKVVKTK